MYKNTRRFHQVSLLDLFLKYLLILLQYRCTIEENERRIKEELNKYKKCNNKDKCRKYFLLKYT